MFIEINPKLLPPSLLLPLVVHTIGYHHPQESIRRSRGFEAHHLLWVTEGSCELELDGKRSVLYPGEGFFCRAGIPHAYFVAPSTVTCWFTFHVSDAFLEYCKIPEVFYFQIPPSSLASFEEFYNHCMGNSTALSRSAVGYAWLAEFLTALSEPHISTARKVRRFLEAHYREPLTLEQIASEVAMSKYALCHYYGKARNLTVMEELKQIRIAKAKELLRFGSDRIEEVGRQCGYESASYFGKQFREVAGCSPGAYRREYRRE